MGERGEKLNKLYDRWGALVLALLALVLMCWTLFGAGGAGLSDNGDFGRILRTNSMEYAGEKTPFVYRDEFTMTFRGGTRAEKLGNLLFSTEGLREYPSVHLIFVRLSLLGNLALNLLTGSDLSLWRMEVLGAIYVLCYAALLYLLFRSFRLKNAAADILVKLACVAVLCDAGYICYFNSLYSEPVQIIALLGAAVFALRAFTKKGGPLLNAVLLCAFCTLYGWAKFINIPVGILGIAFFLAALLPSMTMKRRAASLCAGVAGVGLLIGAYALLPKWMDNETNYNAVFYGALKGVDEAEAAQYLDELGLPEYMLKYAGTNYYMTDPEYAAVRTDEVFIEDFAAVGKVDMLRFYLSHPGRWISEQSVAVAHSAMLRPFYLSNKDGSSPRLTFTGRMSLWGELRVRLPYDTWLLSLLLPALALFLLRRCLRAGGLGVGGCVFVLLAALCAGGYQFLSPILTNGEDDLAKHMLAFAQLVDLCTLFLIARLGVFLSERTRYPAAALAGTLILAALLGFFWRPAALALKEGAGHKQPEAGALVSFGEYGGEPLVWTVTDTGPGELTLLLREPLDDMRFDPSGGYGNNLWADSELRGWLNGEFLESFTAEERLLIIPVSHDVVLSEENAGLAERGKWGFFCLHAPEYCAEGMEDALTMSVLDAVRLPDASLASEMGGALGLRGAVWLDTPYYSNASMVRFAAEDGYVYLRDASESCGVRPIITLRAAEMTGKGSLREPFKVK